MIVWVVRWSVTSLILILLVHYIYTFLIDTLTIPKVKDLVHRPLMRYNEILSDISTKTHYNTSDTQSNTQSNMQTELKSFLMNLNKNASVDHVQINNQADYSAY